MRIFLQESTDVARPLGVARERLVGDEGWFAALATAAEEDGQALYLRIGPTWARGRAARSVKVTLGIPHDRGAALVMPLAWQSSELPGLFPVLDGDLELAPIENDTCRLTLSASYVPPLGELGRQLNRAVLHRVARSTARSFLERAKVSLEAEAAPGEASD